MTEDIIVGRKTMADGSHAPLYKSEADQLLARIQQLKDKRATDMPTEQAAIEALFQAWYRLKELGWNDAIYCPKDGSLFSVIEAGSTGIHSCSYSGEWPKGSWWIHSDNDMWLSRPILFKNIQPNEVKR